jgi:hypothetical protein
MQLPFDGRWALATAIVFAAVLAAWLFRYEAIDPNGWMHRNRITGAICPTASECWFSSAPFGSD